MIAVSVVRIKDMSHSSNPTQKHLHELRMALKTCDLVALRRLSLSPTGFSRPDLRTKIYILLLHPSLPTTKTPLSPSLRIQLKVDVERTFSRHVDVGLLRRRLARVLGGLFRAFPFMNYYQGFHELVAHLQTVGMKSSCIATFMFVYVRDYMEVSMSTTSQYCAAVMGILRRTDPDLYALMGGTDTSPWFCVSWILTAFVHVLDHENAVRLIDVVVSHNPSFVIFFAVAYLISLRDDLLKCEDEGEVMTLLKLSFASIDVERLIGVAYGLMASGKYDDEFWALGPYSMINTYPSKCPLI